MCVFVCVLQIVLDGLVPYLVYLEAALSIYSPLVC